jgi:hypothetical protein
MTAEAAAAPQQAAGAGINAVACSGLTYRFSEHVAVDRVSLRIETGETFGLSARTGRASPISDFDSSLPSHVPIP